MRLKPRRRLASRRIPATYAKLAPVRSLLHCTWLHANSHACLEEERTRRRDALRVVTLDALTRYREDDRLELDSNAAERSLRPIALGRKSWLFARMLGGGLTTTRAHTGLRGPTDFLLRNPTFPKRLSRIRRYRGSAHVRGRRPAGYRK